MSIEIPKLYEIRNVKTGELWVARSRKRVWKKAHHAKCAWNLSERTSFDEQDAFEICDLSTPVGEHIEEAHRLLEDALDYLENCALHDEIFKFLKG